MMSNIYVLAPNDWLGIGLRLGIALLVGGIIGFEREIKDKPAGLRTHILVSFGSAFFTLIPILIGVAEQSADALPRVIQGIIGGIGFLGAGVIVQESQPQRQGYRIRGLTTAAAVWVSSALGVAAGCGLWGLSLISALFILLVLRLFKKIEPSS
ncbi:MAG: MgtC/SapB family protein [Coleofasciculus sp.]